MLQENFSPQHKGNFLLLVLRLISLGIHKACSAFNHKNENIETRVAFNPSFNERSEDLTLFPADIPDRVRICKRDIDTGEEN